MATGAGRRSGDAPVEEDGVGAEESTDPQAVFVGMHLIVEDIDASLAFYRRLGLSVTTLEQFIRLRDHGVTPEYVKALDAQGFKNVPVEDIVRTKDHGVSAEFVADMKEVGLKDLTLPQIIRLRDQGITPGFVNHARARGYKTTDPDELVRLKNGGLWKD